MANAKPKIARTYLRVRTDEQDLSRQTAVEEGARAAGYYVAGVYREKASGARADRPELQRMIGDLQPGGSRRRGKDWSHQSPAARRSRTVRTEPIRSKGAKLAVPGLVDLSDIAAGAEGVTKIVLESLQDLLLKLALQMAREDYETRRERQRKASPLRRRVASMQAVHRTSPRTTTSWPYGRPDTQSIGQRS